MKTARGGRWLRWALLALVLASSLAACTRNSSQVDKAPEVAMELTLDPDPPLFGRTSELTVVLTDADGAPIDNADLTIKGDMTHAGMVPVIVETDSSQDGVYTTRFDWSMSGDWIVTITAELPDGRTAVRTFELAVGLPGD